MNSSPIKNEGWLYGLAFLVALGLRMIQLGASPLTDSEAALALQSLAIARGEVPLLDPQPLQILFTSILFAIIESTNFLARFLPALAGSLFVFVPSFFREQLKPRAALILVFLFAFDPGLVALSRQVNGTIFAITFVFLAWGLWKHGRNLPAGIVAALALLAGPSIWSGLLTIALTALLFRGMESKQPEDEFLDSTSQAPTSTSPSIATYPFGLDRQIFLPFLITLVIGGTLFFIVPNGLSAWLASIPGYFSGWVTGTPTTPARILFTFIAYEPLGLFLGGLAILRGVRTKSRRLTRLTLWLGVSLLLAVFYRQPSELAWAILPLLVLAALELSRVFDVRFDEWREAGLVAVAAIILLAFVSFNLAGIALNSYGLVTTTIPLLGEVQNPRALVLIGSIALIVVFIALVAFGWSARIARIGTTWSFTLFLGLYSVGAAWGASGMRSPGGVELWTIDPRPLQAELLVASVEDVSEFSRGHALSQPITITGIDSPAIEWILRDHSIEKASALDAQISPPLLITPIMESPGLPSAYRGQDFIWRQHPQWEILQSGDWLKWIIFRQLPMENETVILWARDDLFPDARQGAQP